MNKKLYFTLSFSFCVSEVHRTDFKIIQNLSLLLQLQQPPPATTQASRKTALATGTAESQEIQFPFSVIQATRFRECLRLPAFSSTTASSGSPTPRHA